MALCAIILFHRRRFHLLHSSLILLFPRSTSSASASLYSLADDAIYDFPSFRSLAFFGQSNGCLLGLDDSTSSIPSVADPVSGLRVDFPSPLNPIFCFAILTQKSDFAQIPACAFQTRIRLQNELTNTDWPREGERTLFLGWQRSDLSSSCLSGSVRRKYRAQSTSPFWRSYSESMQLRSNGFHVAVDAHGRAEVSKIEPGGLPFLQLL